MFLKAISCINCISLSCNLGDLNNFGAKRIPFLIFDRKQKIPHLSVYREAIKYRLNPKTTPKKIPVQTPLRNTPSPLLPWLPLFFDCMSETFHPVKHRRRGKEFKEFCLASFLWQGETPFCCHYSPNQTRRKCYPLIKHK